MRSLYLAALLCAGCPATGDALWPPADRLFHPTGLAVGRDERWLFVLNANGDLRHDAGTVAVVDLDRIAALADGWTRDGALAPGCEPDAWSPTAVRCDELAALDPDRGARLGNFATDVVVQAQGGGGRLFVAVRGDPSITWLDEDDGELACGGDGALPECDGEHRLRWMRDDPGSFHLPEEPFGLHLDEAGGFVVVTHLCDAAISVIDAPLDGGRPMLSDAIGGLFAEDPVLVSNGVRCPARALGVAGRPNGRIYVSSPTEARVQTLTVARPAGGPPVALLGASFALDAAAASEARDIALASDGARAHVILRQPPTLEIFDISPGPDGAAQLRAVVALCVDPANLAVADVGRGDRLFISCSRAGQLWIVDPATGAIDAIVDVGLGPYGVAVAPGRGHAYLTNAAEDTLAVVDVRPGSVSEDRLVVRLGRPRHAAE